MPEIFSRNSAPRRTQRLQRDLAGSHSTRRVAEMPFSLCLSVPLTHSRKSIPPEYWSAFSGCLPDFVAQLPPLGKDPDFIILVPRNGRQQVLSAAVPPWGGSLRHRVWAVRLEGIIFLPSVIGQDPRRSIASVPFRAGMSGSLRERFGRQRLPKRPLPYARWHLKNDKKNWQ